MQKNNTAQLLYRLVQELDIPVTQKSINEETSKHPDNNSVLAISELLDHWLIPNAAYNLTFLELSKANVPLPFIAFLKKKVFVLVTHFNNEQITFSNGKRSGLVMDCKTFNKHYCGTILVAEKDAASGEADYRQKRRKEVLEAWRTPAVIWSVAILALSFLLINSTYLSSFTVQIGLLSLFKTIGVITTVLLLVQNIDANNPLVQKLCTGSNNKDCNAVLSSNAAKITNELSWSEAGFFYFAGTWLTLLFNSNNTGLIQVLAILNIISLPYTFYSIYYQWRVVKQWCVFCCMVQAVLWLELVSFLLWPQHGIQTLNIGEWLNLVICIAMPVLSWVIIKPVLLQSKKIISFKQQLSQFKYNSILFNKLLDNEVQYALPDEDHSLIIGNREAELTITMVSNPYCEPCAKMHKKMNVLLESRDDIKLQVIYYIPDIENDRKAQVAAHLLSLQADQDDKLLKKALDDWYHQKQKDFETWAKAHPISQQIDAKASLQVQHKWCQTAQIQGTPAIFINGRKLPHSYQPEDISYLI